MKRFMYLSIGVLGLSMVGFTNTRAGTITITCDDHHHLYVDGLLVGSNSGDWSSVEVWTVDLSGGPHVVAIHGMDSGCCGLGLIATIETNDGAVFVTDNTWRAISTTEVGRWLKTWDRTTHYRGFIFAIPMYISRFSGIAVHVGYGDRDS
jgi:hypothetical protein